MRKYTDLECAAFVVNEYYNKHAEEIENADQCDGFNFTLKMLYKAMNFNSQVSAIPASGPTNDEHHVWLCDCVNESIIMAISTILANKDFVISQQPDFMDNHPEWVQKPGIYLLPLPNRELLEKAGIITKGE